MRGRSRLPKQPVSPVWRRPEAKCRESPSRRMGVAARWRGSVARALSHEESPHEAPRTPRPSPDRDRPHADPVDPGAASLGAAAQAAGPRSRSRGTGTSAARAPCAAFDTPTCSRRGAGESACISTGAGSLPLDLAAGTCARRCGLDARDGPGRAARERVQPDSGSGPQRLRRRDPAWRSYRRPRLRRKPRRSRAKPGPISVGAERSALQLERRRERSLRARSRRPG